MKKTKMFSPFAICMIVGVIVCILADAIFYHPAEFTWMEILAIAAAILGVFNVVLSSDGNIWNYIFGVATVTSYGIVAFNADNYGDGVMNLACLLPMQFLGFFMWKNRGADLSKDARDAQVEGQRLSWKGRALVFCVGAVAVAGLAMVLTIVQSTAPWLDATKTVLNITAQVLMTFAFMEQWVLWIIVNIVSVTLWIVSAMEGKPGSEIMIIMWVFYLIISIHGFRVWLKISK